MRFSFKYFICFTIFLIIYWIISSILRSNSCSQAQADDNNVITIIELDKKSDIYHSHEYKDSDNRKKTFLYNRYLPLVFVAGVPGKQINFYE
jgi:hypothetical protein